MTRKAPYESARWTWFAKTFSEFRFDPYLPPKDKRGADPISDGLTRALSTATAPFDVMNWARLFGYRPRNYGGVGRGRGVGRDLGVGVGLGLGLAVGVGVGVGPDCAQYLPPVSKLVVSLVPPQTIISLSVETAV